MVTLYILTVLIGLGIVGFSAYLLLNYIFPKKVEELAQMVEMGQTSPAIKGLNELLEKDDRDPYVHYLLAEANKQVNNIQHAIVEYRQVIKLGRYADPYQENKVRSKLAALYRDQGSLEDAKKEYLILTKIDEKNYEHFYNLGVLFFNASYMEKAQQYFKKATQLNPKHANSHFYLGQIQFRSKLYRDAKESFTKSVSIDPKNYKAHYFLGLVLRQTGELDTALREFEVAQKEEDLKVRALVGKGLCNIDRRQYSQAVAEFQHATQKVRPKSDADYHARYYLAHAAENMRDLYTAIQHWEYIYNNKPDFKDVAQKLKEYDEFRVDDQLKDFMIASPAQFEDIAQKLIESMGYTVVEIKMPDDASLDLLAAESEGKFHNMRKSNRIIKIRRSTESISEKQVQQLHEEMKEQNSNLGLFITTGEFSSAAQNFAQSRPVDLIDRSRLSSLFNQIKN